MKQNGFIYPKFDIIGRINMGNGPDSIYKRNYDLVEKVKDKETLVTIKGIPGDVNRVWINGKELLPDKSQSVYNHSPDGFNWGYEGSGCAQLAIAILLKCLGDTKYAKDITSVYQDFKREFIAKLKLDEEFEINVDINKWISERLKNGYKSKKRDNIKTF